MNPKRFQFIASLAASISGFLFLGAHDVRAQLVVEDVGAIAQDAANQVVNLGKYVEMINNQVQQINTLNQQLGQINAYTKAFGDPSQILNVSGADGLIQSLNQPSINRPLSTLQQLSSGADALQFTGNGLYHAVPNTTLSGAPVLRLDQSYRRFGAINQVTGNYNSVFDDVSQRRTVLRGQIADTTSSLQSSTTDAETQKLTGVLVGQGAELGAVDSDLDAAFSQAVIQDIENRNDEQRQSQAASEEIAADRHDAMMKMGTMLVPDTTGRFRVQK